MSQVLGNALFESWRNFATAFVQFVPRLVAATIIFALGFVVALLVRRAIQWLLVFGLALVPVTIVEVAKLVMAALGWRVPPTTVASSQGGGAQGSSAS